MKKILALMKFRNFFGMILFLALFLIICQPARSQITPGELTFHEANDTIMYNWFSYVPASISKSELSYVLITGIRGSWSEERDIYDYYYNEATEISRSEAQMRITYADNYKYILLVPVIPRGYMDGEYHYPAVFPRKAMLNSTHSFLRRPDLKINLMIDELKRLLRDNGYNINNKVFVDGFSVGSCFAQRYCLLHPERVQAIAAGQCGGAMTVPGSDYNGTDMNWPVGISDYQSLVGYGFNMSSYQQVPQFIYIGDQDNGPPSTMVFYTVERGGIFTQSQIDFLNENFGDSDPVRLENQCAYMTEMGCNITFKLYPGVGHTVTSNMIADIFNFFSQFK